MVIGAAGVALAWGLNVFFVQGGWDIAGIAIGTSCAYFVTATATIVLAARHYVPSMGALFGLLLRTYLPFVYATLVLFVVDAVLPLEQLPSSATLFIIAAKLLVFLVACLPLLWYANRETGVVGLMQQALAARLSRSLARERR